MEPVSFAVGIIGLAGLFSTCLEAVERFDSWKDYDSEFRSLVAQFKVQKLRLAKWGVAVGLEDDELSYVHNPLLDDPKIESTVKELLLAINTTCRDEDKAFLTPMLGKDENPTKDQPFHRHAPRESKRQKLGWVFRTKAKRVAQVDRFSKLVESLHILVPIEDPKEHMGRRPTGDEHRRDLHAWLLGSTPSNELYEIFSERKIKGTCEWVLGQPWFLDWISPDFPTECAKILWINGHAGFGKSVICARVIDHVSSNSKDPVAHFFFSSDFESRRDPFIAIRSWLSQLLRHPVVFSLARERLTTQQGQRATRGDTLKLLRELVIKIPRCTFVLDGLDECRWVEQDYNSNHGASIVDFLEALRHAIAGTSTRLLVVSRDEPEIRACLVNESNPNDVIVIQHSITPEDVRPDLDMFARSIVNKRLSTMTEGTKEDISQKLAECCNGQFLWVQMQESQLHDWKSPKQLEKTINSTPPGLQKTYDREWTGISHLSEDKRERTIALLRWAAFALRPLSVCEMAGALLINADCDEVRFEGVPGRINENYIKSEMMELCGSLIDVRSPEAECDPGSRTVHLAHFTVKEYLLCNLPVQGRLLQLNSSLKFLTEGMENTLTAKMCLCYVDCEEVWQETPEEGRAQVLGSFRDYAARSWYQHASFGNIRDSELVKSVNHLFDIENPNWASWKDWFDLNDVSQKIGCFDSAEDPNPSAPDDKQEIGSSKSGDEPELSTSKDGPTTQTTSMSPLYYATWLGLTDTMDLLLQSGKCSIDEQGNFGRTPLSAACERGHLDAVKKLLDNDADLEIAGDNDHTPLHTAACSGHAEVLKLLLEKGAKIHNGSDGTKTPLYCACLNGHHQVVQMLLEWEPELMATHEEWIPLFAASKGGFLDIVQLLIQKGADIGASNSFRETSLYIACENGHIEVVRLLLDKGADVHHPNQFGWTPVNTASDEGFSDIVLLLAERGADINVPNQCGETPLSNACYKGHIEVVRLLLEGRADIEVENEPGETALFSACYKGHIEVVRLLLDKGADLHHRNRSGWSPVNTASDEGFSDIVPLLAERGADISVPNEYGETPLYIACENGHIEVVRLLLDKGADVHHPNQFGWTPVNTASDEGFSDIVLLLAERGADIEVQNQSGETPLSSACRKGHIEVVRLLLSKGADIHHQSQSGRTPVNYASGAGLLDIVHLLIQEGADIDSPDQFGETPLSNASWEGHIETVRLLLDKGADVHHSNDKQWTAVHVASNRGFLDIVLLLLDRAADINAQSESGDTALLCASANGHIEVVKSLVAKGADLEIANQYGVHPLDVASMEGFLDVITMLLEEGATVEGADKNGRRPLHVAASEGSLDITSVTKYSRTPLHYACAGGSIEAVKLLFEKGADINSVTEDGRTPLHYASSGGSMEVVKLLLEKGADINSVTKGDITPLHSASFASSMEVIKLLLENSADINSVTKDGCTPLYCACTGGSMEVVQLLLEKGADINSVAEDGRTPLHAASFGSYIGVVKLLLDKGAGIESVDVRMGTPLHTASVSGNLDVVNLLLERGAAIENGNFDDRTLLRYVSPHDKLEVINNFLHSEKLRIDIQVGKGCTPTFYVVARGPSKMAKLLLLRLHANAKDRYSMMRLLAAARNGYEGAIEQLNTLRGGQSNMDGLGRDLIWWAIGIGRSQILALIHQWCYTQSFGARILQPSDDKIWSLVNLDMGRICDVCTRPMLINTSYRRCEDCNNFNICLECVGVKVTCLDTVHEWSSL
ncbi:hypothetical protein N7516_006153 [Penicillium verrucosum]|uniref:uncharacterized protein n=1 Tax=Penicillium verrucosum TaxID=60171 RepID=UPI0025450A9F|nr:uncharacterized protein N7516_006153 [Penicillium verrucosum]KAJ5931664.1 hypothetical protein N7516_006153 [Penicillium verrucosum]